MSGEHIIMLALGCMTLTFFIAWRWSESNLDRIMGLLQDQFAWNRDAVDALKEAAYELKKHEKGQPQ